MPYPSPTTFPSGSLFPGTGSSAAPPPPEPVPPVIRPAWTFELADEQGVVLFELEHAWGRRISFVRNGAASVALNLELEDEAAAAIHEVLRNGIPRLYGYRDGVVRFRGFWAPMRERAGVEGKEDALTGLFRSPFARLERRFTGPLVTYTQTEQGEIIHDVLATANALSATGLAPGTRSTATLRDRTYESKQLAELIVQLSEVQGGPDFVERWATDADLAASPDVLAYLDVMDEQGQDRSAVVAFEHGEGTLENALTVERATEPPVNFVRVLGEEGMYGEAQDAASIAKYGHWEKVVSASDGTTEQATLDARALATLRPDPVQVVELSPDPVLAPQPFEDYWFDSVGAFVREGSLEIDSTVRVNGVEITLDDEGNEVSHALAVEQGGVDGARLPPDMKRQRAAVESRLSELERRTG